MRMYDNLLPSLLVNSTIVDDTYRYLQKMNAILATAYRCTGCDTFQNTGEGTYRDCHYRFCSKMGFCISLWLYYCRRHSREVENPCRGGEAGYSASQDRTARDAAVSLDAQLDDEVELTQRIE